MSAARSEARWPCLAAAVVMVMAAPAAAIAQPGRTPPAAPEPGPSSVPGQGPGATRPGAPPAPRAADVEDEDDGSFLIGGSAGFGIGEETGFAASFFLGGMLSERFALIVDATAITSLCDQSYEGCSDEVDELAVLGGGVRLGLSSRWWFQGTAGLGIMASGAGESRGLGWTAATGIDLVDGPSAALDVRLALVGGFFEERGPVRGSLAVGLTIR